MICPFTQLECDSDAPKCELCTLYIQLKETEK